MIAVGLAGSVPFCIGFEVAVAEAVAVAEPLADAVAVEVADSS